MAVQGISKLPITLEIDKAAKLLMKLSAIVADIGRLDEKFQSSFLQSNLINMLALNESVQSTRIEGTQVTFTDMVEQSNESSKRWEYKEVINYQMALMTGEERIKAGYPITTRLILELHSILMDGARGTNISTGEFRKIQNWIGPTNKKEDAVYIPIPANEIESYLENWELFANGHPYNKPLDVDHLVKDGKMIFDESAHPLLKIGILHAQFESIHPFLDGNGRLGRILIALYMIQAKQISAPLFFVSEELESKRAKYYDLLNKTRGNNPDWYSWLDFFLDASKRMANKLNVLLDEADKIVTDGLVKCKNNMEEIIYIYSFKNPNMTVSKASKYLKVSTTTARRALNSLAEKGLLYKDQRKSRNIQYINYDLMDLINTKR